LVEEVMVRVEEPERWKFEIAESPPARGFRIFLR
jgi:hypothetical protein